mgnify:CR=1 FL=1
MADPHASEAAAHGADAAHGGDHAAAAFPPFDSSLFASQLIWFVITFAVLYYVVSKFIIPNVSAVQAKRSGAIKSDLDEAAQKGAAAESAREAMEKASAKARAEARAMVESARADVTAKLTAEQEAAEKRLTAKIEAAEAQVSAARAKALGEVPAMADALARDIADKLVPANR